MFHLHDDVIKWKHFPRYWPFVWGIHRSVALQRPVTPSFDVFFDLRLNERLGKPSWGWWFETPSRLLKRYCNVSVFNLLRKTNKPLCWENNEARVICFRNQWYIENISIHCVFVETFTNGFRQWRPQRICDPKIQNGPLNQTKWQTNLLA